MADFEAITSQEQLDGVIKGRLEREAKKYEGYTSPKDLEALKGEYDKQIADLNAALEVAGKKQAGHEKELAERDAKIKGYETESIKSRIAHEEGLPYGMSSRLSGDTEDDIRADARALSDLLRLSKPAAPLAEPEKPVGTQDSHRAALKKMLKSIDNND